MNGRRVGIALGITILFLASSIGAAATRPGVTPATPMSRFASHISHIVFVILENHAYDNYFGTYCTVVSKYCHSTGNGIPAGTCVARVPGTPSLGCVRPFNFTVGQLAPPDMAHDWNSTRGSMDGGKMDGFYGAEGRTPEPFGHYNGSTIPVYWDMAEQYGLADNFFSPAATYSLPNHWFALGPTSPSSVLQQFPGVATLGHKHLYLNQSNSTTTVEDLLINSTVSWKYYDFALPNYSSAISPSPVGLAYDLWNPLAARAQSYAATVRSHLVDSSVFAADAKAGALPSVSWVIPPALYSDHPPYNITAGQTWVSQLVDSVEGSPEWNSTVLFVTWDEYGGFYDHVTPPVIDSSGDGLRVPLLMIGPWVRQGYIDHRPMDFGSVLHLMEKRFGLSCLGARDCNATLPLDAFNFNRTSPRAPIFLPGYANATYPMPLQSSGKLPPFFAPAIFLPSASAESTDEVEFADGGIG